jgi:hypothetical protein
MNRGDRRLNRPSAHRIEETFEMSRTFSILVALMVAMAIVSPPLLAHHGGAAYDQTKTVTLSGTVTELQFNNPHVLVFFDVKSGEGEAVHWSGWLTAPNKLARAGWTKRTLQAGDQITVSGNPQKNGGHVVQIRKLTAPDGKDLPLFEE